MLNKYDKYHRNQANGLQRRLPERKRVRKQRRESCFVAMYINSGCTFAYERLGIYTNSRQARMSERQAACAMRMYL